MAWSFYNSSGKLIAGVLDSSITNAKMADDAVGADELAANAVVNLSVASGADIALNKLAATTASRLLVSDGSGVITPSSVTTTNLTDLTDSGATTLHSHAGGGPTEATQADMEDDPPGDTNPNRYVSPEVTHFHPGVAKGWVQIHGGTQAVRVSYNVYGTDDVGDGRCKITWATDFGGNDYAIAGIAGDLRYLSVSNTQNNWISTQTIIQQSSESGSSAEATSVSIVAYGTQ